MKILVAEDDWTSRKILVEILKKLGHHPVETEDGMQAWEVMNRPDAPDLLVLDWDMPKMDGIELIQKIRAQDTEISPHIIMLTTKGEGEDVEKALDAHANDYMSKPFDVRELRARVDVGVRMVEAQYALAQKNRALEVALDQVAESEARFTKMAEVNRSIIWEVTPEGLFTFVSPLIEEVLGYSPDELVGKVKFYELHPRDGRDEFSARCLAAMGKLQPLTHLQNPIIHRDGRVLIFETSSSPVIDSQGQLLCYFGSDTDITVQFEQERRIRQMEKLSAIGQLAGGIAHDFNNQLAGITGFCQMLQRNPDPERQTHYIHRILSCAQRSSDLIKKLLAFSHQGKYEVIPLNINELILDVVEILEHSLESSIVIEKALNTPPAWVMGDRGQIENALLNLGINARDAMPHGGRLSFSTQITEIDAAHPPLYSQQIQSGTYVRIDVTDEGEGMTEDVLNCLFEPFFTTKKPGCGTGMGLPMVYGMVMHHGGAIDVATDKGKGTTIQLYFPLMDEV
jgi:PAS domain S-box-containing protein